MEELLDYDGLIYSIINKYSERFDKEDLYQVSMIGLMDAYKHYDKNYDTKFSTFAYYYIVGEVNKYIRESGSLKVSKGLIDLKKKIIKTKEVMTQKLGREPSNLEISIFLDIDENLLDEVMVATDEVDSLDDKYEYVSSYEDTCMKDDILDLRMAIDELDEKDRDLILARYFQDLTQSEVSKVMGMSQVQVSRNESKILQKLKTRL
jgi:RNA polymerase sporulation-specific sigma factor